MVECFSPLFFLIIFIHPEVVEKLLAVIEGYEKNSVFPDYRLPDPKYVLLNVTRLYESGKTWGASAQVLHGEWRLTGT